MAGTGIEPGYDPRVDPCHQMYVTVFFPHRLQQETPQIRKDRLSKLVLDVARHLVYEYYRDVLGRDCGDEETQSLLRDLTEAKSLMEKLTESYNG